MAANRNLAAAAGAWSARHRRRAVLGWLAFVVAAYLLGGLLGQHNLTDAQMGNGASGRATETYQRAFPAHTGEEVLVQARPGTAGGAALAVPVADLVGRLSALPAVSSVQAPFAVPGAATVPVLLSADGRSALVTFLVAGDSNRAQKEVIAAEAAAAATGAAHTGFRVEEFGAATATRALIDAYDGDFRRAEHSSLPLTLLILLLAFGSVMAAGLPLFLGFTAVIATLGLIKPISHLFPVAQGQIDPVILLVGLAVGVDYSMFYLRRYLEERHSGSAPGRALQRAAATSGRAVLVSGLTVMAAMAGMLLAGNRVFMSLGLGTMLVVAVAVLGSVTVLPGAMAALGDRVEWGRVPWIARRRARGPSPAWRWLIDRVLRRPAVSATLATGALLLLAGPALGMRTVDPGTVGLPRSLPIMQTFDRIQGAFPGAPISALVVVEAPDVTAPAVDRQVEALRAAVAVHPGQLAGPVVERVSGDRRVAAVSVSLAGTGADPASTGALDVLRDEVVPATVGRAPEARALVMGTTAASVDFNRTMDQHLPVVFGFVLGMAFLLLLVTFRSVVIPLLTIVLNLLSVGAAYGVTVLVFQDGYGRSLLGATDVGGVISWIPLFLLVVLFGLSMDYHVLILSRIREGHERGLPDRRAVSDGIISTAGVITSAALVMVAVFSVFATLREVDFKQLGVALASAVLIDATVVRIVLLPAAMTLLGRRNWYLPARLRRWGRPVSDPDPAPEPPVRTRA